METVAIIILSIAGLIFLGIIILIILKMMTVLKGKIIIHLDKLEYRSGEEITGKLILTLKEPQEASSLNIGLMGMQRSLDTQLLTHGKKSNQSTDKIIFDFKKPIDGKKLYYAGDTSYNFKLKIPSNLTRQTLTGNNITDTLIRTAQILTSNKNQVRWYVVSNLDLKGFDIESKVQINIA